MIVGKNSALIGFGLLFYTVITLLVLIGCCLTEGVFFTIIGILNTIVNGFVITSIWKYFSKK